MTLIADHHFFSLEAKIGNRNTRWSTQTAGRSGTTPLIIKGHRHTRCLSQTKQTGPIGIVSWPIRKAFIHPSIWAGRWKAIGRHWTFSDFYDVRDFPTSDLSSLPMALAVERHLCMMSTIFLLCTTRVEWDEISKANEDASAGPATHVVL